MLYSLHLLSIFVGANNHFIKFRRAEHMTHGLISVNCEIYKAASKFKTIIIKVSKAGFL